VRYDRTRQSQGAEPTARGYTRDLLAALAAGAKIVGVLRPHVGDEMAYRPRSKFDGWPWVLAARPTGRRFTGREVRAID
jgi:hypothetical protein